MRVIPRDYVGWQLRPWKLDRQPSLFACALLAVREASAAPLERGNKKSAASRMLTRAWSDCAFSRQPSSSFTGPSKRYSLLYEPDRYIWIRSVYFPADFVNLFFNILLELHCICVLCWDERAMSVPLSWDGVEREDHRAWLSRRNRVKKGVSASSLLDTFPKYLTLQRHFGVVSLNARDGFALF
jgi:hypothetical protein